jgi:glycosyltransferase involved in cell wall biosynthesis
MDNILFTIAIPTYNNEKTIEKAIFSCLNQDTDIPYEVLVINNASEDNTANILNQYNDEKIRIITNEKTVTLFENHNVCIRNASGKYIVFCHADDLLEDHAIKTLANKLQKRQFPKKYIVWGHSMFRDYSAKLINQAGFSYNEIIVGEYAPLAFLYGGLTPSGTCYSRDTFLEMGGFLETEYTEPSDYTTMIYLAMNGFRFEMIDEMILWREDASTAPRGDEEAYLRSIDLAFKYFIKKVNRDDIVKLIKMSARQEVKPLFFYYAIAQDPYYREEIRRIVDGGAGRIPIRRKSAQLRILLRRLSA